MLTTTSFLLALTAVFVAGIFFFSFRLPVTLWNEVERRAVVGAPQSAWNREEDWEEQLGMVAKAQKKKKQMLSGLAASAFFSYLSLVFAFVL